MSRDWTPREMHAADRAMNISQMKIVMTDQETGKDIMIVDPESETAKKWPNAYFLAGSIIRYIEDRKVLMDLFEETLDGIISLDDANKIPAEYEDPFKNTVLMWYKGKLDPYFYYRERNDEALSEFLESYE